MADGGEQCYDGLLGHLACLKSTGSRFALISLEQGPKGDEFRKDAPNGPDIHCCTIVDCA